MQAVWLEIGCKSRLKQTTYFRLPALKGKIIDVLIEITFDDKLKSNSTERMSSQNVQYAEKTGRSRFRCCYNPDRILQKQTVKNPLLL